MKKEFTIEIKVLVKDDNEIPIEELTLEKILGSDWKNKFYVDKMPWQK